MPKVNYLIKLFKNYGGYIHNDLYTKYNKNSGWGVFAKKKIKTNQTLIRVPFSLTINAKDFLDFLDGKMMPYIIDGQHLYHALLRLSLDIPYVEIEQDDDPDVSVAFMPIRLAWAVTIHKSQGMTLDAIEIDIGPSIFSVGQAYTALSRARNLKSVRVADVVARSFCASEDVKEFFSSRTEQHGPYACGW